MIGPELAEILGRERPDIRILLMTGYTSSEVPDVLLPQVLPKPFKPKTLLDTIEQALSKSLSPAWPAEGVKIAQ